MKKFTLTILIVLFYMTSFSQTNWEWTQQESGTTEFLRDVFFIDSSTGWVVGANGVILKTINGGDTWTAQTSGTDQELSVVHFIDQNTGWVTGGGLSIKEAPLLKTSDGGETWTLYSYDFSAFSVNDLFFADENNGWVIRTDSVYMSIDGGLTWNHDRFASSVEGPLNNKAVFAISDSVAFIAGRSKRSGTSKTATAFDRRFPVSATPFFGTDGSNQFTTTEDLNCMTFANDTVGFIGGNEGRVYRMQITNPEVTNGPWNLVLDIEDNKTVRSISFSSSQAGMFNTSTEIDGVTIALVYHTEDQGDTWTSVPDSIPNMLSATLHSPDDQNAWIVATGGRVFKGTADYSSIFENKEFANFDVFPNPTSGALTLRNSDQDENVTVSVIDVTGKIISETDLNRSEQMEINLEVETGIYFVRAITDDGRQKVIKIVKE